MEDARADQNEDLNDQLDNFVEHQKQDEAEFIEHFDQTDSQAVLQAIQLQVGSSQTASLILCARLFQLVPDSNDSAQFLTAMQLLYSALTTSTAEER